VGSNLRAHENAAFRVPVTNGALLIGLQITNPHGAALFGRL
jgi:hypothetical protein